MARTVAELPGGARVTDFISLGVISERIPIEHVRRVLKETDRESQRQRKLPMHVMVYYVIALALHMEVSYGEVLRCLLEGLEWLGLPVKSIRTVQMSSISRARMRLGVEPLKRLYEELVVPVATPKTRGAWYAGRRLVSMDGSTLDVADTRANEKAFGRPGSSRGTASFPKIRIVSLVENGTHVLFGTQHGPYKGSSEIALAREVVKSLASGMLCLADRNFFSYQLWKQAVGTEADQLWRIPKPNILPCIERLEDGSYLSKVYPSPRDRKRDRHGITVRVIEYELQGTATPQGGGGSCTGSSPPCSIPRRPLHGILRRSTTTVGRSRPRLTSSRPTCEVGTSSFAAKRRSWWCRSCMGSCSLTPLYGGSCTKPPSEPTSIPTPSPSSTRYA